MGSNLASPQRNSNRKLGRHRERAKPPDDGVVAKRPSLKNHYAFALGVAEFKRAFLDKDCLQASHGATQQNHNDKTTMAKKPANEYLLLFRGGANPEDLSPERMQATLHNWMTWMKGLKKNKQLTLGHPLQESGKALSGPKGKNVTPFCDTPDSIGGYLLIKARNLSEATKIAKGCPIFNNGGTVELRPIQQMAGM